MPKSFNQKVKILYLMKAFEEKTDREHPMSVVELQQYLDEYGIRVERKTVYDDIAALRDFGLKIENRKGRISGYYLEERRFEIPELKILMDAVQSSRFLTQKQSRELIRKLESLTSVSKARKLQQQTYSVPGVKTPNKEVYQNIECIYNAISDNRQVSFQYYEWDFSKILKQKRGGEPYKVSPWKLVRQNENYYLLGLDEKSEVVKHYRVDKIKHINIEKQKRNGESIFRNFDMEKFSAGTFGMFGGNETPVRMEFENRLVGVVLDRFGQDVMLIPHGEDHFSMQVRINVSPKFFGWLAGLGTGAVIVSPENIRREYISFLRKTLMNYGEE